MLSRVPSLGGGAVPRSRLRTLGARPAPSGERDARPRAERARGTAAPRRPARIYGCHAYMLSMTCTHPWHTQSHALSAAYTHIHTMDMDVATEYAVCSCSLFMQCTSQERVRPSILGTSRSRYKGDLVSTQRYWHARARGAHSPHSSPALSLSLSHRCARRSGHKTTQRAHAQS